MDSPFSLSTILFFIFSLFLPHSFSNFLPTYQLLIPKSLPSKPSLSDTTWSISSSELTDKFATGDSAILRLKHIDAISTETSPEALFLSRMNRDAARVRHLTTKNQSPGARNSSRSHDNSFGSRTISGRQWGSGEYFTRIGVGTPPRQYNLILDTGSEITWLQCDCIKRYSQPDPIFDPTKSSSFHPIKCGLPFCPTSNSSTICGKNSSCAYGISYGDGSFTKGKLVSESLYFGKRRIENITIGCGQQNEGSFTGASGLFGLSQGTLGFPHQSNGKVRKIFSYCLTQRTSNSYSYIVFGDPCVQASSTVYVPLVSNPSSPYFYYLGLTGMSVGGVLVPQVKPYMFEVDEKGDGGVIIDSGTVVTWLTDKAYIPFRDMFRKQMKWSSPPSNFSILDTCYNFSGKYEVKVPSVGLQFGKVMVDLPGENYIAAVDDDGTNCLIFTGQEDRLSIIGNTQQMGFKVIYDLEASRVGFEAGEC